MVYYITDLKHHKGENMITEFLCFGFTIHVM